MPGCKDFHPPVLASSSDAAQGIPGRDRRSTDIQCDLPIPPRGRNRRLANSGARTGSAGTESTYSDGRGWTARAEAKTEEERVRLRNTDLCARSAGMRNQLIRCRAKTTVASSFG